MRRLKPGEEDGNVGTRLEGFVEKGFLPVRIAGRDPLFSGLGDVIYVDENHYCEVKEPPPEFDLLASTEECRIQAMKCRKCLLYGVQFHPQVFDDEHLMKKGFLKASSRWLGNGGKAVVLCRLSEKQSNPWFLRFHSLFAPLLLRRFPRLF